jgi:hypothetical protein
VKRKDNIVCADCFRSLSNDDIKMVQDAWINAGGSSDEGKANRAVLALLEPSRTGAARKARRRGKAEPSVEKGTKCAWCGERKEPRQFLCQSCWVNEHFKIGKVEQAVGKLDVGDYVGRYAALRKLKPKPKPKAARKPKAALAQPPGPGVRSIMERGPKGATMWWLHTSGSRCPRCLAHGEKADDQVLCGKCFEEAQATWDLRLTRKAARAAEEADERVCGWCGGPKGESQVVCDGCYKRIHGTPVWDVVHANAHATTAVIQEIKRRYTGQSAPLDEVGKPKAKRGRGRPRKDKTTKEGV